MTGLCFPWSVFSLPYIECVKVRNIFNFSLAEWEYKIWIFHLFAVPSQPILQTPSMAGQLKEVRNRIKSNQKSQQVTKAMKMVSAGQLRRAQDPIIQMRPYAQKLQELLSNIVSG